MSRTETKGQRKRTITEKQNTSNSSYFAKEVTPQIISFGTKPFVIFTDFATCCLSWLSLYWRTVTLFIGTGRRLSFAFNMVFPKKRV